MSKEARTSMTLRALRGTPLSDQKIRAMVQATAHAIAERQGFRILALSTTDDAITVTLNASRIATWGFMAELRRQTAAWYAGKFHAESLWGELPPQDAE